MVIDEVHAFAGDDRGWHLLAVLERLTHLTGRALQRIGLSATVGNPAELVGWLQGAGRGHRSARVVAPEITVAAEQPDVQLDHVGTVDNAARVIAALHRGEKRLVFCDSRTLVERLGAALRELGVTTFLSHASLSADERRRAEQAFSEARDCVIVSTSTLELGIDVGDLDRVIQLNAPSTVAAFLQRLGRTGRRPGARRNCLLLAMRHEDLLTAAGLLVLWGKGFVEPVVPPPEPRHIAAQQLIALCLQEHRVGGELWPEWWHGLGPLGASARPIAKYLVQEGFLDAEAGMLFVGPQAEKRFGRRNFMDLTAVFTAPPQFTVLHGRDEIGRTDPSVLVENVSGPRLILLAGHTWRVTWIDWTRRRCLVEEAEGRGRARWLTPTMGGISFALARAMRDVLLGADPDVRLTKRAVTALAEVREDNLSRVHPGGTVLFADAVGDLCWWTWAGYRANATLKATLGGLADQAQRVDELFIRLRTDIRPETWRSARERLKNRLCLPEIDEKALAGLKFSAALPAHLARATLSARLADLDAAAIVLTEPSRFTRTSI